MLFMSTATVVVVMIVMMIILMVPVVRLFQIPLVLMLVHLLLKEIPDTPIMIKVTAAMIEYLLQYGNDD